MEANKIKFPTRVSHLVSEIAVEYSVVFEYDSGNPFEVSATFHPPGQGPVTWVFGRELLTRACYEVEPYGDGDIRVHSCDPGRIVHMEIEWTSVSVVGFHATLHFHYDDVAAFLKQVNELVPPAEMALRPDAIDELIMAINDWGDPRL